MFHPTRICAVSALTCCAALLTTGAAEPTSTSVKRVEVTVRTVSTKPEKDRAPLVQVALLLDTSNSMDGLIGQAQAQLWAIVNELADKRKNGSKPRMEVALFEYGNNSLPATENYIRQVVPLTGDLDRISEALFGFTTNGGSEYCGAVISEATSVLDWKKGNDHYKAIFIAGNEPFTQGEVDHVSACLQAKELGVVVNTIFCGGEQAGVQGKWKQGAAVGGGKFLTINQDHAVTHIDCPQDAELLRLNIQLNSTYIPFGELGDEGALRQQCQDSEASGVAPAAAASRVVSKAKANAYRNSSWDLVDAMEENGGVLTELSDDALPELLREKSPEQRKAMVMDSAKKRKALQGQISVLAKAREGYLELERAKAGDDNSLGNAVQDLIREQAREKGFK